MVRHRKANIDRGVPHGPEKQEHKDVLVRNVLTCINGKWSRFDNLLKAKTILLPEHYSHIYITPDDLKARCAASYYLSVVAPFNLSLATDIWDHLWNTAYDPYKTVEHYNQLDNNPGFKPVKIRNRRKLSYRLVFDRNLEQTMKYYYGLPPQARTVIDILEEAGRVSLEMMAQQGIDITDKHVSFEEEEIGNILMASQELLFTRQPPFRIFQYYRGKLIQYNFLRYAK